MTHPRREPEPPRVLIVGGGIAGLATARALRQRDISSDVVDRRAEFSDVGVGINLPGNAVYALRQLGIDALEERGMPIRRREYRNAKGRLLFAVDEAAFWGTDATSVCVHRADLVELLIADLPANAIRWKRGVDDVVVGESVQVRFADGATQSYDFVIGADGVHSAVRKAILGAANPQPALLSAASWRFMSPNVGVRCWTAWSGAQGMLLLIPVDQDHVYGFASATRGGPVEANREWLRRTFQGFPEMVGRTVTEVLGQPDSLFHSPVEEVRVPRWSNGRIVLIGDAAHATAPVWAQGAALAIEDAIVLANLLATTDDWSTVGQAFERLRRARVTHVQKMTDQMSRIARLPIWLRDAVAPAVGPRSYRHTYGPLRDHLSGMASSRPR
jgi:2-polyprenyl-6-methoxyphenol hydroxylase-like FAD-dependent oxidoreductase